MLPHPPTVVLVIGVIALAWFGIGWMAHHAWQTLHPHSHAEFGVKDVRVRELLTLIRTKYTRVNAQSESVSGHVHRTVFDDHSAIAYYDEDTPLELQRNCLVVVIEDKDERYDAARETVDRLNSLGFKAQMRQPFRDLPEETYMLVVSDVMDFGLVFRPNDKTMERLEKATKEIAPLRGASQDNPGP